MTVSIVTYQYQIEHARDPDGNRFPRLSFQVASAVDPSTTIDTNAYLDSGAAKSLLSGRIGMVLGIDVLSGPELMFQNTTESRLVATLHPVRITHPELGSFGLEVGFSITDIHRNLLGRDFFNLVQIGFPERFLTLFATSP